MGYHASTSNRVDIRRAGSHITIRGTKAYSFRGSRREKVTSVSKARSDCPGLEAQAAMGNLGYNGSLTHAQLILSHSLVSLEG